MFAHQGSLTIGRQVASESRTGCTPDAVSFRWAVTLRRPAAGASVCAFRSRDRASTSLTRQAFGSKRIRHATATLLVDKGMPLEDVKRCVCRSRKFRRVPRRRPAPAPLRAAPRTDPDEAAPLQR